MFAAATWLRRAKNRMLVKKEIKSAKVKAVFTEPRPSDIAYAESIMDLPPCSTDTFMIVLRRYCPKVWLLRFFP